MKTLQEQYNLIKEGKGHKGVFLKEAKRLFPNIVPNAATFEQTAKLLKQRSVISENIFPLIPSAGLNPFTSFDKFINEEAKATETKPTKEVSEKETAGYDYKDQKNSNNQIYDQYINGLKFEMEQNPELLAYKPTEALLKVKEIVVKNLEKDPLYYMKNAAFGVKDLGYTELKKQEDPTGKYKSSGYGDLKENTMNKSDKLIELLEEAIAGVPSLGNPFADRKKTNYESKFEAFLTETEDEKIKEGEAAYEYKRGEKAGEEMEKKDQMKKKGRMKMAEVLKEAERLGEMARKKVQAKIYEKAIKERKEAMSINEDESLSEFINQSAIQEVAKEIKELERNLMEVSADENTMSGGK
jgi:hypothetical protein